MPNIYLKNTLLDIFHISEICMLLDLNISIVIFIPLLILFYVLEVPIDNKRS